jgi:hypothetical protein
LSGGGLAQSAREGKGGTARRPADFAFGNGELPARQEKAVFRHIFNCYTPCMDQMLKIPTDRRPLHPQLLCALIGVTMMAVVFGLQARHHAAAPAPMQIAQAD